MTNTLPGTIWVLARNARQLSRAFFQLFGIKINLGLCCLFQLRLTVLSGG